MKTSQIKIKTREIPEKAFRFVVWKIRRRDKYELSQIVWNKQVCVKVTPSVYDWLVHILLAMMNNRLNSALLLEPSC